MARAHLLLASAALLLAFLPGSQAVLCESFASKERCEGVNTDSGVCGWDAAAAKCAVVVLLPEGRVAITSLDQPAPQGETLTKSRGQRVPVCGLASSRGWAYAQH